MKANNSKAYIKKLFKKYNVPAKRITNSAGNRVWSVNGKEYASLDQLNDDLKLGQRKV